MKRVSDFLIFSYININVFAYVSLLRPGNPFNHQFSPLFLFLSLAFCLCVSLSFSPSRSLWTVPNDLLIAWVFNLTVWQCWTYVDVCLVMLNCCSTETLSPDAAMFPGTVVPPPFLGQDGLSHLKHQLWRKRYGWSLAARHSCTRVKREISGLIPKMPFWQWLPCGCVGWTQIF